MAEAGLPIGEPPLKRHGGAVQQDQVAFFTNAVLCLKAGGASAKLPKSAVGRCRIFLRETIEIIRPKIVLTLGKPAFDSLVRSYKDALPAAVRKIKTMTAAAALQADPPEILPGTRLVPAYHCGSLGQMQHSGRPLDRQLEDWRRLRRWLA